MKATPAFMAKWRELIRTAQFPPEITQAAIITADLYEDLRPSMKGLPYETYLEALKFLDEVGVIELEGKTYRLLLPTDEDRRPEETVLYHYYDSQGVLLYIGITRSLPGRQASHEKKSTWMEFAARSEMYHFATREDAADVEREAIRVKRPLFNVEYNDRPDRVARLVDYLIDRDRRDLLVPLVSRG